MIGSATSDRDATTMNPLSRDEVSAALIVDALGRSRHRCHPEAWIALCLDVLVHIGGADGGALVDQDGRLMASVGMSRDRRDDVTAWLTSPETQPAMRADTGVRAAFTARLSARSSERLALWWSDPSATALDADAVAIHGRPLTALLESLGGAA